MEEIQVEEKVKIKEVKRLGEKKVENRGRPLLMVLEDDQMKWEIFKNIKNIKQANYE